MFLYFINVLFSDKPGKPQNLKVLDILKDSIGVSWEKPSDLGGCELKKYVIEKREANRNTWSPVCHCCRAK